MTATALFTVSLISVALKSFQSARKTQKLHVIAVVLATMVMTQTGFPSARNK